jgi:mannitol-1-phosphate 5-dehydrogenase
MYTVNNFITEFERKLYAFNLGNAALGYLGFLKNYTFVHKPFLYPFICSIFNETLDETSEALSKKYPEDINMKQQREAWVDVITRFGNPMLQDTVLRVARDPISKLGPDDRIVGSINLCLIQLITAAFKWQNKESI